MIESIQKTDNSNFNNEVETIISKCGLFDYITKNYKLNDENLTLISYDFLALNNRGVSVFHLFQYNGKLIGASKDRMWLYNNQQSQNLVTLIDKDMFSLKSFFLKHKFVNFYTYAVFPDDCDISDLNVGTAIRFVNESRLKELLKADDRRGGVIYNADEVKQVASILRVNSKTADRNTVKTKGTKKYKKKHPLFAFCSTLLGIAIIVVMRLGKTEETITYIKGVTQCVQKEYDVASDTFDTLDNFLNSEDMSIIADLCSVVVNSSSIEERLKAADKLDSYPLCHRMAENCRSDIYKKAYTYFNSQEYEEAAYLFNALDTYKDSQELYKKSKLYIH